MPTRSRPFPQHDASTIFVRVPPVDWPAVKRGVKTEFRQPSGTVAQMWRVKAPTPCVAYTVQRGAYAGQLMVLDDAWQEPLGAIGEESLRREGFASLAEFRRYWMSREHRRFRPTRNVWVFRLRPWAPGDEELFGRLLFERLYGEYRQPVEAHA